MKCPNCQMENREGAKFCSECGENLEITCPQCGRVTRLASKFCDECGCKFERDPKAEKPKPESESERKNVTVLFSDLCRYTALSEKLDPEEVKEITSRLFGRISEIIGKYEGVIEKFIGDAVVALFGAQTAHEDDPVRAIRAAREIHGFIDAKSPEMEKRIGQPLAMHTGINTGLVVTGKVDVEKGTHGIAGDTINLASRLQAFAKPGEVLVGYETYRQAEGFFNFEELKPAKLKGRTDSVQVFKVLSAKEQPIRMHRISGLRAELIGRKVEMTKLREAFERLREGSMR